MLETIKQIKEYGLEKVVEKYKLKVNTDGDLIMLNYNMIESSMSERVSQECRGLILEKNDWTVVSCPFFKFFNHGEGHAAKINWEKAKIYEKLDGSLMTLYFYKGEWRVASSGNINATGQVNGFDFTFNELFWKTWKDNGYNNPGNVNYCYMFELCSPFNRIVVRYLEPRIVLIGARCLEDLQERPVNQFEGWQNWQRVKEYSFFGYPPEHLQAVANSQNPVEHEGFVVCDDSFNRVKMKGAQYVAVHHLRVNGSPTPKNFLELIMSGEWQEYISYFPEYKEPMQIMQNKLNKLIEEIDYKYFYINHVLVNIRWIPNNMSQKEFALEANKYPFSGILFNMRKNNTSAKEELEKTSVDKLLELMEKV
jgi:hypothetical protein